MLKPQWVDNTIILENKTRNQKIHMVKEKDKRKCRASLASYMPSENNKTADGENEIKKVREWRCIIFHPHA